MKLVDSEAPFESGTASGENVISFKVVFLRSPPHAWPFLTEWSIQEDCVVGSTKLVPSPLIELLRQFVLLIYQDAY